MSQIYLVSDHDITQYVGGAELDDACLLEKLDMDIEFITSQALNTRKINPDDLYIISNFMFLSEEKKNELIKEGKYIIYEKDFKLCKSRVPDTYQTPLPYLPYAALHNVDFYENAKYVVCITDYQERIYASNMFVNTINIHGVLYSDKELDLIEKYIDSEKNGKAYVFGPKNHQNMSSIFANRAKIEYDVIDKMDRETFLKTISQYNLHIFLTNVSESCSRQAIENRIFGTGIIAGGNVGVLHEDWYNALEGRELFEYVKNSMIPGIIKRFTEIIEELV